VEIARHRIDQHFGDVKYKLTNIQRAEPSPSLFKIPAGYKIVYGSEFRRLRLQTIATNAGCVTLAPAPRRSVGDSAQAPAHKAYTGSGAGKSTLVTDESGPR
jgi:hypothetical protein